MPVFVDRKGQVYGRLTVLQYEGVDRNDKSRWLCRCNCGQEITSDSGHLNSGHTRSCGCLQREVVALRNQRGRRHGMSQSSLYKKWGSMLTRCINQRSKDYPDYGGRGITVCDRWRSFENFLADMGHPPAGLTLDRIDNDKGYEPGNCRWATLSEQNSNRRPQSEWRRRKQ